MISELNDLSARLDEIDNLQNRMFCFFQNIPELCLIGINGHIKANKAWYTFTGYPVSSNIALEFIVHPDDYYNFQANIHEEESTFTCRLRGPDGSYVNFQWIAACPDGHNFYATARKEPALNMS